MQFTVREAARFLNVSEKTLYRWAGAGEIPVYRVDGQYRFNPSELLEWATTRHLKVSTEVFRTKDVPGALPTLTQALEAGGVFHKLPAADRDAALRAMIQTLKLPEQVDRAMLYEVLAARESLGTTAVGNGIAIPHVRRPMILEVGSAMIALFFLEKPVDFGAADKKPVHTLFWLVAPTVKVHLHMLSRLAAAIRDPAFLDLLLRQAPAGEILDAVRRVEEAMGKAEGKGS